MGKQLQKFVEDSRPAPFGSWTWPELQPMIELAVGQTLVKEEEKFEIKDGPEAGQVIPIIWFKRMEIAWSYDFYEPPHDARSELFIRNGRPLGQSDQIRFYYFDIIDETLNKVTYKLYCSAISGWMTDHNELCADLVDAICTASGKPKPPMDVVVPLPKPVAWLRAPKWVTEKYSDGHQTNGPVALCFADELDEITQSFVKQMTDLTGYKLGIDLNARSY